MLSRYLATRKGNCVSMPVLFVVLAQKLGLDASIARSPHHFFVKYRDETGHWYNLETTSGGYPRKDESYPRDTPMSALALKNGLYMRPMTKRQTVRALVASLIAHHGEMGQPDRALMIARLAYDFDQNDAEIMLAVGHSYYLLLQRDFLKRYLTFKDIPASELPRFGKLSYLNRLWFEKAEALGWQEPDAKADERYLQMVKNVKST